MTILICCVSGISAEQAHVKKLVSSQEWEGVICVGFEEKNSLFSGLPFIQNKDTQYIQCSSNQMIPDVSQYILDKIKNIESYEVALNLVSGSGKLHMGLLAAILKTGLGIRLIGISEKGIIEI